MRATNAKIAVFIIVLYLCFHKSKEQCCECNAKIEVVKANGGKLFIELSAYSSNDTKKVTLTTDILPCLKKELTMTLNWNPMCNNIFNKLCLDFQRCATCDKCVSNISTCAINDTIESTISQVSKTTPALTSTTSPVPKTTPTVLETTPPVPETTPPVHETTPPLHDSTLVALRSAVGLLVLALALVTIGWIWTCVVMNKRKGLKINSVNNRYTGMDTICGKRLHTLNENRAHNGTQLENKNQESSTTVNTGEMYEVIAPLPYETVKLHAKPVRLDEIDLSDVQVLEQREEGGTRKSEVTPEEDTGEQDCSISQQDESECKDGNAYHTLDPPPNEN